MKFSIGDKVLLRRTGEEGIVTAFLSHTLVEVMVAGTTFPVYEDDLEHPYLKWFTEQGRQKKAAPAEQEIPTEKLQNRQARLPQGIHLAFFPQFVHQTLEDVVESIKIYLVNELPTPVRFTYKVKLLQGTHFALEGTMQAFSNLYVHEMAFELMNDSPRFEWKLADAHNDSLKAEEGVVRIRPGKLFDSINKIMQLNEPSFTQKLLEAFVAAPKPKPEPKRPTIQARSVHAFANVSSLNLRADFTNHQVVDLHIEKLLPDVKGLSNAAIMEFQLQALQRALQTAIVNRQEQMIIIHGIGSGVLKDAVHRVLAETPEVLRFSNEWLGKYGFGATEVIFK